MQKRKSNVERENIKKEFSNIYNQIYYFHKKVIDHIYQDSTPRWKQIESLLSVEYLLLQKVLQKSP